MSQQATKTTKSKKNKGKNGQRRQRNPTRTVPGQQSSKGTSSTVTTTAPSLRLNSNGVKRTLQDSQNQFYDGTGRLYECMSVAELNIRLRNLASHCLESHKGDVAQRERLMHDIKDIQKGINDLLAELKQQIMREIRNKAQNSGNNEEQMVQLQKQNEGLQAQLMTAEKAVADAEKQIESLQSGIDDQCEAIRKQGQKDLARAQKDAKKAKRDADGLRKQLEQTKGQLSERDERIGQLGDQIRDGESTRQGLADEIESLREQLDAKAKQQLSIPKPDPRLQATIDELRARVKALTDELARARNESKSKEETIDGLVTTNDNLQNTLNDKLEEQFDEIMKRTNEIAEHKQNTEELKEFYKQNLDRMHKLWQDASEEIRTVFDKNYNDLRERLEGAYNDARDRCNDLEDSNGKLIKQVDALRTQKLELDQQLQELSSNSEQRENTIAALRGKIKELNDQLIDLQVKISQYRVIWNHFMTLEGKLKNEIGHLSKSVTDFEEQMRVEPPMPKRRRVAIGAIREYTDGLHLPIELSEVPVPELLYFNHHFSARRQLRTPRSTKNTRNSNNNNNNNNIEDEKEVRDDIDNERFLIINNSPNTHFELVGEWRLVNDRQDFIKLPRNLNLAPGGSIGVCMGNETLLDSDLKLSTVRTKRSLPFITFAKETDRLYLEDTVGQQIELFNPSLPNAEAKDEADTYNDMDNDIEGGTIEEASRVGHYVDIQEIIRLADKPYFTVVNVGDTPVVLRGFKLRREKLPFNMRFPEIEITRTHPLKFVFATEKDDENDILIDPKRFGNVNIADNLVLEDKFGARHTLLPHIPSPQRPDYVSSANDGPCSVM